MRTELLGVHGNRSHNERIVLESLYSKRKSLTTYVIAVGKVVTSMVIKFVNK
jgi:hypothetical protein